MVTDPTPEELLAKWIKLKTPVTVFLVNGVKLQGTVTSRGDDKMVLTRGHHSQVVYDHAVSTVMPNIVPTAALVVSPELPTQS